MLQNFFQVNNFPPQVSSCNHSSSIVVMGVSFNAAKPADLVASPSSTVSYLRSLWRRACTIQAQTSTDRKHPQIKTRVSTISGTTIFSADRWPSHQKLPSHQLQRLSHQEVVPSRQAVAANQVLAGHKDRVSIFRLQPFWPFYLLCGTYCLHRRLVHLHVSNHISQAFYLRPEWSCVSPRMIDLGTISVPGLLLPRCIDASFHGLDVALRGILITWWNRGTGGWAVVQSGRRAVVFSGCCAVGQVVGRSGGWSGRRAGDWSGCVAVGCCRAVWRGVLRAVVCASGVGRKRKPLKSCRKYKLLLLLLMFSHYIIFIL